MQFLSPMAAAVADAVMSSGGRLGLSVPGTRGTMAVVAPLRCRVPCWPKEKKQASVCVWREYVVYVCVYKSIEQNREKCRGNKPFYGPWVGKKTTLLAVACIATTLDAFPY